ncbi:MAG: hypothetical protein HOO90_11475 [Methylotenera sp.]|uniref:YceD family protein n=1 Tax=Methylotenera sp. TaxID=2051956 RepID=UPI00180A3FE8|nr:YceD family protein [Methylotenera sp.]NOU26141.1 hypothetical protein [Methylotenera sp.]
MSNHPIFIDNLAFAKKNEYLTGQLLVADSPRLGDFLGILNTQNRPNDSENLNLSALGTVDYKLQGKKDALGQYLLYLSLNIHLTVICQRCLSEMPLKLKLSFNYLIGDVSDADVNALEIDNNDDFDLQQANKAMDVIALIEDEIIMAMPIAPMHEEGCTALVMQSGEKPNPFAALKGLIKP